MKQELTKEQVNRSNEWMDEANAWLDELFGEMVEEAKRNEELRNGGIFKVIPKKGKRQLLIFNNPLRNESSKKWDTTLPVLFNPIEAYLEIHELFKLGKMNGADVFFIENLMYTNTNSIPSNLHLVMTSRIALKCGARKLSAHCRRWYCERDAWTEKMDNISNY